MSPKNLVLQFIQLPNIQSPNKVLSGTKVQSLVIQALFGSQLQPASNSAFLSRQISPATCQPASQQYFFLTINQYQHQPPTSRTRRQLEPQQYIYLQSSLILRGQMHRRKLKLYQINEYELHQRCLEYASTHASSQPLQLAISSWCRLQYVSVHSPDHCLHEGTFLICVKSVKKEYSTTCTTCRNIKMSSCSSSEHASPFDTFLM